MLGVFRTSGQIAAAGAQKRRDSLPVNLDQPETNTGHFCFPTRRNKDVRSCSTRTCVAVAAFTLAPTTKSTLSPISCRFLRNVSRIHRLTRLRVTAFPTWRLTLIPMRGCSHADRNAQSTKFAPSYLRPLRCTKRICSREQRRKRRPNASGASCGRLNTFCSLLLGRRNGQTPASFAATALKHLAPASGTHALAKTMRSLTSFAMGLIRSFH